MILEEGGDMGFCSQFKSNWAFVFVSCPRVVILSEESKNSVLASIVLTERARAALESLEKARDGGDGLLLTALKSLYLKMDTRRFWEFVIARKKELENLRSQIPMALVDCVDPPKLVLEAVSEVFLVDKRGGVEGAGEKVTNNFGWACVVILESLIPVMVDSLIGKSRLLVTPSVKEKAKEIAETWKASLEERRGIENVKTHDVHTFTSNFGYYIL